MKIKDLKKGDYFKYSDCYVNKLTADPIGGYAEDMYTLSDRTYYYTGQNNTSSGDVEMPTQEEIEHLEQCIAAGKFVEYVSKPETIDNYSIF